MKTSPECQSCFTRQAAEAAALATTDPVKRDNILLRTSAALASMNFDDSPPAIAQQLHRIIREESGQSDPYLEVKRNMNHLALQELPALNAWLASAADKREAAVRIAVAGNLLDSGAKTRAQPEDLPELLSSLWKMPLAGDIPGFFSAAGRAGRILYLADNAGEIVFDRLLLDFLPVDRVTLAVRGRPILNDALAEDAAVAGFSGVIPIIDNGSDAPGTLLADCSPEFRDHFERADFIISKGQGNFESLSEIPAPIFFLFMVKCPIVAEQTGEPTGTMIVRKSELWQPSGQALSITDHEQ